ncbi:MAG: D-glycero-beta-D-manno-heptose 1-phosphate adenylyltransferase [Candidatus Omnitrophica bacterium]|nr:D-glycero-beta-D-manno-heptose 1-phosphate adenylyltransferase [Candidatus Omnitrophota bacterium]
MGKEKIKDISGLKVAIKKARLDKKRIVFTNGCFDILHKGHIQLLTQAKEKGDLLIVAVNSDSSIRRIKGRKRPLTKEGDRTEVLAALEMVDNVVLFNEETPAAIIREVSPDILVKGGDWKEEEIVGADFVKSKGGEVYSLPYLKGYSTSSLITKIQEEK